MGQYIEMSADVVVDVSALLTKNKKKEGKPDVKTPEASDRPKADNPVTEAK